MASRTFWSLDLFRVESLLLKSYLDSWVMVAIDIFTRWIIGFGVAAANFDGIGIGEMFNYALSRHPSADHAPLFSFHRWQANLRVLEVDENQDQFPVRHLRTHSWSS